MSHLRAKANLINRQWRLTTALTLGVIISMTACGLAADPDKKLDPRLQRMVPADTPAVAVTARAGQPAETRLVSGKFFSMYVPANFQEKLLPMANGEQMATFDAPSSKPATPVRVAILPDTKPAATVIEQTYTAEMVKKSEGAKDITRSIVKWPGAQSAVLLQWTETQPGAVATDEVERTWQLAAQVSDRLIVNILVVAPASEFDSVGLAKVIETFRPHA